MDLNELFSDRPWMLLNHYQLGQYSKSQATTFFISHGFHIHSTGDDLGYVDFVVRYGENGMRCPIKVRSIRMANTKYCYILKDQIDVALDNYYLFFIVYDTKPECFLIPVRDLEIETDVIRQFNYTKPEYGIYVARKNLPLLEPYRAENMLKLLI